MKKNIKIILGDICYPKSEAIIIPANTKGIMSKGIPFKINKDSLGSVYKEVKKTVASNDIKIGECFTTGPGRLIRRGLKKIYHAVIKRLQSDFTSIYIIEESLEYALKEAIKDEMRSISICGIGIEPGEMDKKSVAMVTWNVCNRFDSKIEIKIIDEDVYFINEMIKLSEE